MKKVTSLLLTLFAITAATTVALLYSDGWRINKGSLTTDPDDNQSIIIKTGMLAVRSMPDAAQIIIDGKTLTATDTTISSLKPGTYTLEIKKEGYETWKKQVNIYPEVVTDITAVLVLQSPKLESLTNSDVNAFNLSSNGNMIAYLTQNHKKPGVWVLPLTGSTLNLFKTDAKVLIEDNAFGKPSLGEDIWWSPDDSELLVQLNKDGYLLYETPEISTKSSKPINVTSKDDIFARWQTQWEKDFLKEKLMTFPELTVPDEIVKKASESTYSNWSPDNDKFFFIQEPKTSDDKAQLMVYNLDNPLPIDENRLTNPMQIEDPDNTYIYWYTDSYHLITVEKSKESENQYTISLLRIDGSNKTPIYTGALTTPRAFTTPGGNQIIVRTSLKENSPDNLYGITIR